MAGARCARAADSWHAGGGLLLDFLRWRGVRVW